MQRRRSLLLLLVALLGAMGILVQSRAEGREPPTRVQAHFSPDGGVTEALRGVIRRARRTLDVAVYVFSASALAKEVISAHRRGVRVRVLFDEPMSRRWSQAEALAEREVPLWRVRLRRGPDDASPPQFHHKFAVVDGEIVVTGSFNWTVMAERSNHENLLVVRDRDLARRYTEVFEKALALAQEAEGD